MIFRQLQAFHAVIEKGTVTSAAQSLGISQPAISNLLAQLQAKTNLELFKKDRGRLVATPEASILFTEIDTVVRGLSRVDHVISNLQNERVGSLQIAVTHAVSFGFMTGLVSEFVRDYPNIDVLYQTRYSHNIQEWVESGLVEIGVSELPVLNENLISHPLRFVCRLAIPESSPLVELKEITPKDLDNIPFIEMGADHIISHRIRQLFLDSNARLRIKCQSHLFRSLLEFVKTGLGVALIDPFTLANDDGKGYVVRPFKPSIYLDMAIIHHKSRPISSVGLKFIEQVKANMSEYGVPIA